MSRWDANLSRFSLSPASHTIPERPVTEMSLLILFLCLAPALGNVVDLDDLGKLKGSVQKSRDGRDFFSFTSVPYAKPPLGELRFKSPQPVEKWSGTLDASGLESPRCTQIYYFVPALRNMTMGQEDCLYLNVFTPKLDSKANLPVMVYLHGGGWRCGEVGGHSRAAFFMDHDVVLVTPAYRLSALGFLSTEDDVIPGNFGLKDQAMALRWVNENIRHFGGDPDSVTVFGESAGGASAHYHMMSPLSKGLIKGAISESGVATTTFAWASPGDARTVAHEVANIVGCPTECHRTMLQCLRTIDDKKLVETEHNLTVIDFDPTIPFQPVVEAKEIPDAFITESPDYAETHLPWIHGMTSSEGSLKAGSLLASEPEVKQRYIDEFVDLLPITLMYRNKVSDEGEMAAKIKEKYFKSGKPTMQNIIDIFSDALFLWPGGIASKNHKGPQWYYLFDHRGQNSLTDSYGISEDLGVGHADEILYLFNFTDAIPELKPDQVDRMVSDKLIKLWVDFAKYGNPTPGHADVKWKQYGEERDYLHMATEGFKMEKNLLEERFNYWNSLPFNRNLKPNRDEL